MRVNGAMFVVIFVGCGSDQKFGVLTDEGTPDEGATGGADVTDSGSDPGTDPEPNTTSAADDLVELCVHIASSSGYSCADWVADQQGVEFESCGLTSAEDGELWVLSEGWNTAPVATNAKAFDSMCAQIPGEAGDVLKVNGRFETPVGQIPIGWNEFWWCANWYSVPAQVGHFTVDGVVVTPELYGNGGGGYDCLVPVP